MNSATLKIGIEVDDKGSVKIRQLGKTAKQAGDQADTGFKKAGRSLGDMNNQVNTSLGSLKALFAVVVGSAAVAALKAISAAGLQAASDMEETQGKFNVVFRGLTQEAEGWASTLQSGYAMAGEESKRYLSSIQDLLVPTGMARDAAGQMSFEFVKLAADLGSFNNTPTAQVVEDIQSALQGSSETMAKYGINVKQAKIEQEVLTLGLAKSKKEITDVHKAQALLSIAYREGSDAVGDMARTSESYANQEKRSLALIQDMKVALGEGLLPTMTDIITSTNAWVDENKELLKQDIKAWGEAVASGIEMVASAISGTSKAYNGFIGWLEKAQDYLISIGMGYEPLTSNAQAAEVLQKQLVSMRAELEKMGNTDGIWATITGKDDAALELEMEIEVVEKRLAELRAAALEDRRFQEGMEEDAKSLKELESAHKHIAGVYNETGQAASDAAEATEEAAKAIRRAKLSFSDALEVGWDDANNELVAYAGSTKKLKDIYESLDRQLAKGKMSDQDRIYADADREARRLLSSVNHLTEYTNEYNSELEEVRGMLIDVSGQSEETTGEMTDYWGSFAESTKDASKELFEKGIKGDIESLSEAAEIMADSVVDIFADMAAQIMANWVATGITGMFTGKGLSGFSMPSLSSGSGSGAVGTATSAISIAGAAEKISEWASNAGQYVAEALGLAAPASAGYGVLASSGAAGSAVSGASIYAASQTAAPAAFSVVPTGSYAGASAVAAPSTGVGIGASASLAPLAMLAVPAVVAATLSFMSTGSSMAIQEITSQSGRDLSLTAFGSTRGEAESKYSDPYWVRAQVGAVSQYGVNTIGDMGSMRDVYTGMSDTIHGIFKAMRTDLDELAAASEGGGGQIEAITDSIATLGDKLEDTYTAMEIKATEYGDSVAALGLQMNQGVKEFDAFADAATGFDFSMDQSAWMMEQASLAADGNADAYNRLYQSLISVTGSTEAAIAVTGDMVSAMNELSGIEAPSTTGWSSARSGYHPNNPAPVYSENTSVYVPPVSVTTVSGTGYHPNNPAPDRREEKLVERIVKAVAAAPIYVDVRSTVELDGRAVDARAKNVITKYVARKVGDGRVV